MNENLSITNTQKSAQIILELRKKAKPKIYALIAFLVLIGSLTMYYREIATILIVLLLSTVLYGIALKIQWAEYAKMIPVESGENEDTDILISNLNIIKRAVKTDHIISIITFPSALVLTIIIFETLTGSESHQIIESLKNPGELLIVMILIGIGNYFLNEHNFRDDIKQLEDQIA